MKKNVVIIGAGGHGKVIADIVRESGDNLLGYLDDAKCTGYNSEIKENILGNTDAWEKYLNSEFIVGIGSSVEREKFSKLPVKWYTAIHPSSTISPKAVIGEGSVVMANAVINADAKIGKHCIINTSSVVEHDNIIEDYAHISVGVKLGGSVKVGKSTWVGIGVTVINGVEICADCMIGAGAVVVKNIITSGTYMGIPAVQMEKK